MTTFPPVLPVTSIQERLSLIFPEGTPNRNNCTREIAAKTIFVMLYIGAVEGHDIWARPDQITRMTDTQAALTDDKSRQLWLEHSLNRSKEEIPGRWYAVNTRESIRDDTIRSGLLANGAITKRPGLPTTSPLPSYALESEFSKLFDPNLQNANLHDAIDTWRQSHLSPGALARITIRREGATASEDQILVTFPNGETRLMAPGPSSVISKAVIEKFTQNFLDDPAVVFLSESANKVVQRDEDLARSIGLNIKVDENLPDIILADLGPSHPLLVFVEVVASDGPVSEQRRKALLEISKEAGFPEQHVTFLTAYLDRSDAPFKKTADSLAWGSFVWFSTEPDNLLALLDGETKISMKLSTIVSHQ